MGESGVLPRFLGLQRDFPCKLGGGSLHLRLPNDLPKLSYYLSTAATIKVASSVNRPPQCVLADCKIRSFKLSADSAIFFEIKPSNLSSPNSRPWASAHSLMP